VKKKKVQIELPESIYRLLQQVAEASEWPLEEVLLQSVKSGLPPSTGKVPEEFRDGLLALCKLDDRSLLRVVEGDIPAELQGKGGHKGDFKLLQQTYALRLLKWRGHPIPPPFEALIS